MLVFGGFINSEACVDYSNSITNYNFDENKWTLLTPKPSPIPSKRANCGGTIIGKGLVIFGGINGKIRFNDLWRFDLLTLIWEEIKGTGTIPKVSLEFNFNFFFFISLGVA